MNSCESSNLTHHKVSMAHDIIGHIALYQEVMHPMSSDGSVEGVVYGAVAHIRTIHAPAQVKVDGVPP